MKEALCSKCGGDLYRTHLFRADACNVDLIGSKSRPEDDEKEEKTRLTVDKAWLLAPTATHSASLTWHKTDTLLAGIFERREWRENGRPRPVWSLASCWAGRATLVALA